MIERVCVIGAGVIGSLFAGHLAQVADVCVLTRRREHADALNARRAARQRPRASSTRGRPRPPTRTSSRSFDVGIVATKANGLEDAAASLEGRFPEATIVTTLTGSAPRRSSARTATGRSSPASRS